jgi:hypothetical protein
MPTITSELRIEEPHEQVRRGRTESSGAEAHGDRQRCRACPGRPHLHRADQRPVPYEHKGSPAEYGAGLKLAIALSKHESGTYVKLTQAGADLFALPG